MHVACMGERKNEHTVLVTTVATKLPSVRCNEGISYHDNPLIRLVILGFVIFMCIFFTSTALLVIVGFFYLIGCKVGLVDPCARVGLY